METLLSDVRHAFRSLRKAPMYTFVAVLTLGLGLGATTVMLSLGNWVAWRPVPGVGDPDPLVTVELLAFRQGTRRISTAVSYPDVDDLRRGVPALSDIAAYNPGMWGLAPSAGRARRLEGAYVTQNYFSLLHVPFAVGGPFTPQQERAAAIAPVAVISYALWRSAFGHDRQIVGRRITLNGVRVLVTGVTARGFEGARLLAHDQVWMPISAQDQMVRWGAGPPHDLLTYRGPGKPFNQVLGRLAPDATTQQAEAQLGTTAEQLARVFPVEDRSFGGSEPRVGRGIGVPPKERDALGQTLDLLAAVSGVILLIALANVANLCLLRNAARATDLAVRRALGAPPRRLVRQQLAETLLLALPGGVIALALTGASLRLFQGLAISPLEMSGDVHTVTGVHIDWRVLAGTVLLVLTVGLVVGLLPSLPMGRADVASALKVGATRGSRRRPHLRSGLSVIQMGASFTLLVAALLLGGTLRNLRRVDLGFDAPKVSLFMMSTSSGGYGPDETRQIVPDLLARLRSVPGVEQAALTYAPPLMGINLTTGVRAVGMDPADPAVVANNMWVSPTYFPTLGIPLVAGQPFADADMKVLAPGGEGAAVISETLARRLFGRREAIGQQATTRAGLGPDQLTYRIVGVARDSRWSDVAGAAQPFLYRPLADDGMRGTLTAVTRSREPAATRTGVEQVLAEVLPAAPVYLSTTLADQVNESLSNQRLFASLATACTFLALLLAGVGLYVVVANSVAERTKDFGIRVALGARAGQVLGMVLRQGAQLGAVGLPLGLAGAAAVARLIGSRLYGLDPLAPGVYLTAAGMLAGLVLSASVFPARRAARVDPMVALRAE